MTIRSVREEPVTTADEGKWAVPKPVFQDGFCGRPVLITKVSKSRVYYIDTHKAWDRETNTYTIELDAHEQFMSRDSLVYVCETKDEAVALHTMSERQCEEIRAAERAVKEKYREIVAAMC